MTGTGCNLLLFEDYTTCTSVLEVCRNHPVDQVLDRQLNRSKLNGEEEENISENKETFLDTLKKTSSSQKVNAPIWYTEWYCHNVQKFKNALDYMVSAEWNATMKQWWNNTDKGIMKYEVLPCWEQREYSDLQLNIKKIS